MISCDKGNIKIKGSKLELMSDMTSLIETFKENIGKEEFEHCLTLANMSKEELGKALEKARTETVSSIEELLKEIRKIVRGE